MKNLGFLWKSLLGWSKFRAAKLMVCCLLLNMSFSAYGQAPANGVTIKIVDGFEKICEGSVPKVEVTNPGDYGYRWQWRTNDNGIWPNTWNAGSGEEFINTFDFDDTVQMCVLYYDDDDNKVYSNIVTIIVIPNATAATIEANGTTICTGETTKLTASASEITSPTFNWYSSQTAEATLLHTGAEYTTQTLTTTTTYYVSVSGTNYCENAANNRKAVTVTVNPLAVAATIEANGTAICSGEKTTLTASSSLAGATYKWYAIFCCGKG
jgi:hypothetical protein